MRLSSSGSRSTPRPAWSGRTPSPALPAWLALSDQSDGTATLTGTPANEDVGEHAVCIQVHDTAGLTATQAFKLTVHNRALLPIVRFGH